MNARADTLARLLEAIHEGVFVGTIGRDRDQTLAVNRHLKRLLGFPPDVPDSDVAPLAAERFVDPAARQSFLDRLETDGLVTDCAMQLRRLDDTPIWVEVTARRTPGAVPAEGASVEAVFRDVTDRKRLDDETRALYHQLLQAEKMAALGQTISGVAHELNNPLATVLSWAERLSQKPGVDDGVKRGLEIIHGESQRAARIVRSLLTFARKRQTTRALVDLNRLIRETLALGADERAGTILVIDALASGLPPVFADGHQLQQVLLNLVVNAEQAMRACHGRGTLVVRTWHDAERDSVALEVNDDGSGMSPEVQAKIFEPFFSTKGAGGTGLGLTVAYAIVHDHGGTVRVESAPGKGTSFFVELPVTGTKPPVPREAPAGLSGAGRSVLLIEDERALASAVADALQDAGYAVERASDGEQGLAVAGGRDFDAIVCDLKMPKVDGRAFYARLQASRPALAERVVFVTGDVAGTEAESFLERSGRRWLAKPFRLNELLQIVREVAAS